MPLPSGGKLVPPTSPVGAATPSKNTTANALAVPPQSSGIAATSGSARLTPFVTKRPAAPRPGCRSRCRALGFLLSFSIAKRKKQRKMLPPERYFAPCGERPGLCPWTPPPFEKGGPKLYRPSALASKTPGTDYRPLPRLSPQRGRVGRDSGGTPEGVTPAARRRWPFPRGCGTMGKISWRGSFCGKASAAPWGAIDG